MMWKTMSFASAVPKLFLFARGRAAGKLDSLCRDTYDI